MCVDALVMLRRMVLNYAVTTLWRLWCNVTAASNPFQLSQHHHGWATTLVRLAPYDLWRIAYSILGWPSPTHAARRMRQMCWSFILAKVSFVWITRWILLWCRFVWCVLWKLGHRPCDGGENELCIPIMTFELCSHFIIDSVLWDLHRFQGRFARMMLTIVVKYAPMLTLMQTEETSSLTELL